MDSTPRDVPRESDDGVADGPEVVGDREHSDYSGGSSSRSKQPRKAAPSAKKITGDDDGIIEGAAQPMTPPSFGGTGEDAAAQRRLRRLQAKRGGEKTSRSIRALLRNSMDDDNGEDDMHRDDEAWTSTNWRDRAMAEGIPGAYGHESSSSNDGQGDFSTASIIEPALSTLPMDRQEEESPPTGSVHATDQFNPIDADATAVVPDIPIVAELALDEDQVVQRVKASMEAEMELELEKRFQRQREMQVVAEVVNVDAPKKPRKWLFFVGAVCLVAVVVGTILAVMLGGDDPPTTSVTTASFNSMVDKIGGLVTSDPAVFENDTSAQYAAMDWLANSDEWVEANNTDSTDHRELVERYVLALLYFSTNGNRWRNQNNFLEPFSVCGWSDENTGAYCRDGMLVREIVLGKLFLAIPQHLMSSFSDDAFTSFSPLPLQMNRALKEPCLPR